MAPVSASADCGAVFDGAALARRSIDLPPTKPDKVRAARPRTHLAPAVGSRSATSAALRDGLRDLGVVDGLVGDDARSCVY